MDPYTRHHGAPPSPLKNGGVPCRSSCDRDPPLQIGMYVFQQSGLFQRKRIEPVALAPLALAFVGYIVLCNLNLNLNTVGFYQITK